MYVDNDVSGDVFVAVDKWKNARLEHPKASTEIVAAVALPDAAAAMFLTTLTTAVAFFATAICPVAPIKMFAIFCGLLIIFDYIMNVLLVFPALCIYDDALMKRGGPSNVNCCIIVTCCGLFQTKGYGRHEDDADGLPRNDADTYDDDDGNGGNDDEGKSLIRHVLLKYYDTLHVLRWPLVVLCMVGLGLTAYYASTLALPTSSDVRLLEESNEFERSYLWRQKLLSTALTKAGGSQAYVTWGLEAADTGDQSELT